MFVLALSSADCRRDAKLQYEIATHNKRGSSSGNRTNMALMPMASNSTLYSDTLRTRNDTMSTEAKTNSLKPSSPNQETSQQDFTLRSSTTIARPSEASYVEVVTSSPVSSEPTEVKRLSKEALRDKYEPLLESLSEPAGGGFPPNAIVSNTGCSDERCNANVCEVILSATCWRLHIVHPGVKSIRCAPQMIADYPFAVYPADVQGY